MAFKVIIISLLTACLPFTQVSGCEEINVNYGGNDIAGGLSRQQNWGSCFAKCQTNFRCKYWTFRKKDGNCWLKTRANAKTRENGLVSGPSDCSDSNQILLQSEGDAAEWQGHALGFFDLVASEHYGGRPLYRQKGGNFYMFYHTAGAWTVSSYVNNTWSGIYPLAVKSTASLPPTSGWKYIGDGKKGKDDRTLKLVRNPRAVNSCNQVEFSSYEWLGIDVILESRKGLYSWTGAWKNGRKVYSKGDDYLYVPNNESGWGISKFDGSSFGIAGGRATTCPCSAGASRRKGWNGWQYYKNNRWSTDSQNKLLVKCS